MITLTGRAACPVARPVFPIGRAMPSAGASRKETVMSLLFETEMTAIGVDVPLLAEQGVLILFADGAPPELAEVSVLHRAGHLAETGEPGVGAEIRVGGLSRRVTAIGPLAWAKVREIGHIVITFNGATEAERPGEISAEVVEQADLLAELRVGNRISLRAA